MAKTVTHESSIRESLGHAAKGNYLGDPTVVGALLRTFASRVLTSDYADEGELEKDVDAGSRVLARVLLGQDQQFGGSPWNSPGQIDVYVARRKGVDSSDPVERVAGALVDMITDLLALSSAVSEHAMPEGDWKWQADEVIQEHVNLFMGIPT